MDPSSNINYGRNISPVPPNLDYLLIIDQKLVTLQVRVEYRQQSLLSDYCKVVECWTSSSYKNEFELLAISGSLKWVRYMFTIYDIPVLF